MKFLGPAPTGADDIVDKAYADSLAGGGGLQGAVQSTAPSSPPSNYLWVDTSEPGVLELTDPSGSVTPAANTLKLFARNIAGRRQLAMMGPSGLDTSLQPLFARNGAILYMPVENGTTPSVIGGAALTATGTANAASFTAPSTSTAAAMHLSGRRVDYLNATASTTAVAGFRQARNTFAMSSAAGMGGFQMICRFSPATGAAANTTRRTFVGVTNSTAAPTDVDPSALAANILGVGYSSADTNWQIYSRGTAAMVKTDTGMAKPAGNVDRPGVYECAIFCAPGSLSPTIQFQDMFTGNSFQVNIPAGTGAPANGTALSARGYHSAGGTSSVVGLTLFGLYIETDY